jgi:integrase/recombinase XerC
MDSRERAWIDRFLSHLALERRLSAHTVAAYRHDLSELAEFAARRKLAAWSGLDHQQLRAFAAACTRRLSPRSIQRRLSAARTFYGS